MAKIPWMDLTWRSGILKPMAFDGCFETSLRAVLDGDQGDTSALTSPIFAPIHARGCGN